MLTQRLQRSLVTALLTATATLLAAGCGATGEDKAGGSEKAKPSVLTLANANGSPFELKPFAAAVGRLSGGTLRIRFRNSWRAGDTNYETGVIRDVQAGKADLAWAGSRAFDSVGVTSLDALHAPLLIDSYALERRVLESPLADRMLTGVDALGLVGLGVLPGPMRKPLGVAALAGPADYRGKTIAVNRSRVAESSLRALGARPKEIARGAPITGTDGVEQQLESIAGNDYNRDAGYVTANVNLWPRPLVLFMNKRAFAALTDRQRGALRSAGRAALPATLAAIRDAEKEAAGNICRGHTTFVTADTGDVAALRRALQPVYAGLERDPVTSDAIKQITALRGEVGPSAAAESPTCPGSQGDTTSKATPIDGRYEFTTSAAELRRAGAAAEIAPENLGSWHWVLDRGRYSYTQRNGTVANERSSGTYTVDGDLVALTVQRASGRYPTHSGAKPGERFTYRWSLFRDRLSLTPVKGKISPMVLAVNPWRRVGAAPVTGSTAAATPRRTPVDGSYRMTTTADDTRPAASPSNYGIQTYVLDRGNFAYTQENSKACTWAYGTFRLHASEMQWLFTDGGGVSPDNGRDRPGGRESFGWSRYRDTMTLTAVQDSVSPENHRLKPWRVISARPSRAPLSKRCPPPAAALPGTT